MENPSGIAFIRAFSFFINREPDSNIVLIKYVKYFIVRKAIGDVCYSTTMTFVILQQ
jgi:hypothetical protein